MGLPTLPDERKYKPEHATRICRAAIDGTLLAETICIATIEVDGVTYKGNGQHTCGGLLEAYEQYNELPVPTVNYQHYQCETIEDACQLYAQFDPIWSGRRFGQIAGPIWATDGMLDLAGSKRSLSLIAGALAFDKGGQTFVGKQTITGLARINLPAENRKYVADMVQIFGHETDSEHLRRDAVACAILQTLKVSRDAGLRFWIKVRDGDMLTNDDPRKRCEVYLRKVSVNKGRGAARTADSTRKAGNREVFSKCIQWWNAWRTNRTTDAKFYPNAPLPTPV
jgi:hypothetical protein